VRRTRIDLEDDDDVEWLVFGCGCLPMSEARTLAQGRTAVIYHHNSRYPGGHAKEVSDWIARLGPNTTAMRWRAYGSRTFFVMNPTPDMFALLETFSERWGPQAEFYS
jgi:hypothetical protein